jgi:hypothetical protein
MPGELHLRERVGERVLDGSQCCVWPASSRRFASTGPSASTTSASCAAYAPAAAMATSLGAFSLPAPDEGLERGHAALHVLLGHLIELVRDALARVDEEGGDHRVDHARPAEARAMTRAEDRELLHVVHDLRAASSAKTIEELDPRRASSLPRQREIQSGFPGQARATPVRLRVVDALGAARRSARSRPARPAGRLDERRARRLLALGDLARRSRRVTDLALSPPPERSEKNSSSR